MLYVSEYGSHQSTKEILGAEVVSLQVSVHSAELRVQVTTIIDYWCCGGLAAEQGLVLVGSGPGRVVSLGARQGVGSGYAYTGQCKKTRSARATGSHWQGALCRVVLYFVGVAAEASGKAGREERGWKASGGRWALKPSAPVCISAATYSRL